MWDDRRITARYRGREAEVERELEPYGLVLKAGVWYLCARVAEGGSFRVYRIDRFTAVTAGGERFVRDEEFDLPGFWEERAEQFARSILRAEVVVRLSADGARRLPYAVDPAAAREALAEAGAPDEDGWVTVTLAGGVRGGRPRAARGARAGGGGAGSGEPAGAFRRRRDTTGRAVRDITIRRTPRAPHPSRADAGPVMDETEFWELVDATREAAEGDPEEQADLLVDRLLLLDPEMVLDFARHFEARYNRAYTWDLWGAAWVLLDGASDDAFDFFRCWLIGQGREVYEGAVHDPDSLADLLDDFDEEIDGDGEELGYAADEAYEQLTGTVAPDLGIPPAASEPLGASLDLENERVLAQRYPKLWERFRG